MIFLLLFSVSVLAGNKPDVCALSRVVKIEREFPVSNDINYFMRGAPATGEVGFATASGNRLLNVVTGEITPVPGEEDPVLSPDGKILTVPENMGYDPKTKKYFPAKELSGQTHYRVQGGSGQFSYCTKDACTAKTFPRSEVLESGLPYSDDGMSFYAREGGKAKLIFRDEAVPQKYQSLGMLSTEAKSSSYRMLFEGDNELRFRDYSYNSAGQAISPIGPVRLACAGLKLALPMLSKNGEELVGYDPISGTTKVFYLGKDGGICEPRETIPGLVGKADFSPDGKALIFHIDQASDSAKFFKNPNEEQKLGVFIFDRLTHALIPAGSDAKENAYYPVFWGNSKIAYIKSRPDAKPGQMQFSIVLGKVAEFGGASCEGCTDPASKLGQMAALVGALHMDRCPKGAEPRYKNAMAAFGGISPKICSALVESCGESCLKANVERIAKIFPAGWLERTPEKMKIYLWDQEVLEKITQAELQSFCRGVKKSSRNIPDEVGPGIRSAE
jgi:hypothetical protein